MKRLERLKRQIPKSLDKHIWFSVCLFVILMGCGAAPSYPFTRVESSGAYTLPAISTSERVVEVTHSPTPVASDFSATTDSETQLQELAEYIRLNDAPSRVMAVDLATHPKVSQFRDIDSTPQGYGKNACGLVAAAAALGGEDWVPLVKQIADAAGDDYSHDTGIQPSKYVAALQQVFSAESVAETNESTLGALYRDLAAGKIVIVDIKVSANTARPSTQAPNYAHFARVLGMDVEKGEIYLENTLAGKAYWTLTLDGFLETWEEPETGVSMIPDPTNVEQVTRWMVSLDNSSAVG